MTESFTKIENKKKLNYFYDKNEEKTIVVGKELKDIKTNKENSKIINKNDKNNFNEGHGLKGKNNIFGIIRNNQSSLNSKNEKYINSIINKITPEIFINKKIFEVKRSKDKNNNENNIINIKEDESDYDLNGNINDINENNFKSIIKEINNFIFNFLRNKNISDKYKNILEYLGTSDNIKNFKDIKNKNIINYFISRKSEGNIKTIKIKEEFNRDDEEQYINKKLKRVEDINDNSNEKINRENTIETNKDFDLKKNKEDSIVNNYNLNKEINQLDNNIDFQKIKINIDNFNKTIDNNNNVNNYYIYLNNHLLNGKDITWTISFNNIKDEFFIGVIEILKNISNNTNFAEEKIDFSEYINNLNNVYLYSNDNYIIRYNNSIYSKFQNNDNLNINNADSLRLTFIDTEKKLIIQTMRKLVEIKNIVYNNNNYLVPCLIYKNKTDNFNFSCFMKYNKFYI